VRLKPIVAFLLRDAGGTEVARSSFQMDTFFAHTDTLVSISLEILLPPGTYTIELTLSGRRAGRTATEVVTLTIGEPAAAAPIGGGDPGPDPGRPEDGSGWLILVLGGLAPSWAHSGSARSFVDGTFAGSDPPPLALRADQPPAPPRSTNRP
jgi:hypothetical protein